jgi:hypothetical protein
MSSIPVPPAASIATEPATEYGVRADDDLRKLRRRAQASGGRVVDVTSSYLAGSADAVADGWRAFADFGPADRMADPTLGNSWLQGTIAGYAAFFDRLADSSREVLERLRDRPVDEDLILAREAGLVPSASAIAAAVVDQLKADPEFIRAVVASSGDPADAARGTTPRGRRTGDSPTP